MNKSTKMSAARVPSDFFSVELSPLSAETTKRMSQASKIANERISHNNQIYTSSNSHASSYATK